MNDLDMDRPVLRQPPPLHSEAFTGTVSCFENVELFSGDWGAVQAEKSFGAPSVTCRWSLNMRGGRIFGCDIRKSCEASSKTFAQGDASAADSQEIGCAFYLRLTSSNAGAALIYAFI